MLYEYESVFSPVGPDSTDFNWYKWTILQQPTEALINDFKKYESLLNEHRLHEPAKKRKNKTKYKVWVTRTHDYLEILNDIYEELQRRKNKTEIERSKL